MVPVAVRREQRREGQRLGGVVHGQQQFAVRRQRHFVKPIVIGDAAGDRLFVSRRVGRVKIEHLERTVAVTGIEPPAVRSDAIGAGLIVVYCYYTRSIGWVEYNASEKTLADGPLEGQGAGIDDVDTPVRAIAQIVFGAMRIDPADVVRLQWFTRDLDCSQAFGLGVGRRSRPGASGVRCPGSDERGSREHCGH